MQNIISRSSVRFFAAIGLCAITLALIGAGFVGSARVAHALPAPNWNVTGNYVADQEFGGPNMHDMALTQSPSGDLSGSTGGYPSGGPYTAPWVVTSGTVSGNTIEFFANYTAPAEQVTPQNVLHVLATIAPDGSMSGTWDDNYQGAGPRTGTWTTTSGAAVAMPMTVSISPNTGSTAGGNTVTITGTGLSGTTVVNFGANAATGVVVNSSTSVTAISPAGAAGVVDVTVTTPAGTSATSLADQFTYVSPIGNSPTTNAATGITSMNATLNGMNGGSDASTTAFWVSTSTFTPVGGPSPVLPANVYSTGALPAVASSTAFSAPLSSATIPAGLLPITPNTTYYFVAWSEVAGMWSSGAVLNFNTASTSPMPIVTSLSTSTGTTTGGTSVTINGSGFTGATSVMFGMNSATGVVVNNDSTVTAISPAGTGTVDVTVTTPIGTSATSSADKFTYQLQGVVTGTSTLAVTSIDAVDTSAVADGTFANGWKFVFNVTLPTNETNLAMKFFPNWVSGANTFAIPNNMRISSAQADNSGATVLVTAANSYTTPNLHMTTDLDPGTPGIQVQVSVEVQIPVGTANGSYSTNYGVQTN